MSVYSHRLFVNKYCSKMICNAFLLLIVIQLCQGLTMNSVARLPTMDFRHKVVLDQLGSYVMMWNPLVDKLIIEVQVRNLEYVGLGFSPNGGMKGADIVIGWVDNEGIVHFSDRHGIGNLTPIDDVSQNYQLLGGSRNETHTIIRFSRLWDTCDSNYDLVLTDDTVRVIWAYGALQRYRSKTTIVYHDQNRGTKSLYLKEPKTIEPPPVTRVQTWDVRSPEVEIPSDINTLYWCKLYKIPNLPWKHHVIGYVPIIEEKNLPHVHHMLLYECSLPNSELHLEKWLMKKGAQCFSKNMPTSWRSCGAPIIAWAVGSEGEMLPEHVGFPLGENHGGSTYFLLEIHYDNPKLKKGIVDQSGLRLLLTDKIRRYDAGVLTLGHKVDPFMIVPPAREWITTAHCSADCTQKTIPATGINVYSGVLHAHLLGQSINVSHIRDGKELEPLLADNSYDFNYQQSRSVTPERKIYPGDHIITKCSYDATKKINPTFGGFGTEDEMCLAFFFYYPRIDLSHCLSRPDIRLLFGAFGIENLYNYEKTMNVFSEDIFGIDGIGRISSTKDRKDLETMENLNKAGQNSEQLSLANYFKVFNISQPSRLHGKTFYEILSDENIWQDENFIGRLEEITSNSHYEPICLYPGRRGIYEVPVKAKPPHFASYQSPKHECISSPIEGNHLENSLSEVPGKLNSEREKFPWLVSIQWIYRAFKFHLCSGAIVGNQWILTAAHCTNGYLIDALEFVAGVNFIGIEEGTKQILKAAKIYEHEGYNLVSQENDITLVKLEAQFIFDSIAVASINLPTFKETFKGFCEVSGWQKLRDTITSGNLQKERLPIISNDVCQQQIRFAGYRLQIKDTMMCTGIIKEEQDFCKGDSGGPLVCQGKSKLPTLAGIVSWGIGCNIRNIPGVYTEVSQYISWINRKISEDSRQSFFQTGEIDGLPKIWTPFSGRPNWSSFSNYQKNHFTLTNDLNVRGSSVLPTNVNFNGIGRPTAAFQPKTFRKQNKLAQEPALVYVLNSSEEENYLFPNPV